MNVGSVDVDLAAASVASKSAAYVGFAKVEEYGWTEPNEQVGLAGSRGVYVERLATQGPRLLPEDIAGVGRSMNIDIWIVLSSEPSEDDDAQDIGE